jgi:hypothetical protein
LLCQENNADFTHEYSMTIAAFTHEYRMAIADFTREYFCCGA